jgi:hypothetical protein
VYGGRFGSSQRVNIQLAPGGSQERVEVAAAAPLVETTGNTMGGTIDAKEASELPLNGRDFTKLPVLLPGSTGDASGAVRGRFQWFGRVLRLRSSEAAGRAICSCR